MKENREKAILDLRENTKAIFGEGKRNSGSENSLSKSLVGRGGVEPLYLKYEK